MPHPVRGCTCHGERKAKCRKGRPLCRRSDVPRNVTCNCGAYHFPHRTGSGLCLDNPRSQQRLNKVLYG